MIEIKTIEELTGRIDDLVTLDWDRDPVLVSESIRADFVEDILEEMERQGINRTELAKRMGKSRQYVSRVLNEDVNFTTDTLALFACAVGCKLHVSIEKLPEENHNGQDSQSKTISFPEKNADAALN